MLNTNNNLQTQTSSALHNAIMEASATNVDATLVTPGNDGTPQQQQQPRDEIRKTFPIVSKDIQKWITTKAEVVQIILTRIDNDIYSIVDAFLNVVGMWKETERLKQ
nr:hypothetical protein [Tanacetum cinerariifolium]